MAVDLSKVICPARAAVWAEHVETGRPRDQSGPERRRPQPRLAASCSFQRSTTPFASARAATSAACRFGQSGTIVAVAVAESLEEVHLRPATTKPMAKCADYECDARLSRMRTLRLLATAGSRRVSPWLITSGIFCAEGLAKDI
jgi:hypothetical protein